MQLFCARLLSAPTHGPFNISAWGGWLSSRVGGFVEGWSVVFFSGWFCASGSCGLQNGSYDIKRVHGDSSMSSNILCYMCLSQWVGVTPFGGRRYFAPGLSRLSHWNNFWIFFLISSCIYLYLYSALSTCWRVIPETYKISHVLLHFCHQSTWPFWTFIFILYIQYWFICYVYV